MEAGLTLALLTPVIISLAAVVALTLALARRRSRYRASLDQVTHDLGTDPITGLMSYGRWCLAIGAPDRYVEAVAVFRVRGLDRVDAAHGIDATHAVLRRTARRLAGVVGDLGELTHVGGGVYALAMNAGSGALLDRREVARHGTSDGMTGHVSVVTGMAHRVEVIGGVPAMIAKADERSRAADADDDASRYGDRQWSGSAVYSAAVGNPPY